MDALTPTNLLSKWRTVPNSAAGIYKTKELLQLGTIVINQGAITGAVSASGIHVNAYPGDVTGNGTIDGLDVATASALAQGNATGFAAYQLLDPAIVGDVALDYSVDAGDVSDLAAFTVHLPTPVIPAIPTGLTITPVGADPTLSLGEPGAGLGRIGNPSGVGRISNPSYSRVMSVPVLLDDPHPNGSTGMTEAILALTYDPSVLSVSPSDITLGSIPGLGTGWQISSVVNSATGQIAIELYSTTPITATQAGSLVNIAFHLQAGARPGLSGPWDPATAVQLVNSVTPRGQQFTTQVDDAQGQLVLSPGTDRVVVEPAMGFIAVQSSGGFQPPGIGGWKPPLLGTHTIGSAPLLNALLYRNSPRQLAADRLFLPLARRADVPKDDLNNLI